MHQRDWATVDGLCFNLIQLEKHKFSVWCFSQSSFKPRVFFTCQGSQSITLIGIVWAAKRKGITSPCNCRTLMRLIVIVFRSSGNQNSKVFYVFRFGVHLAAPSLIGNPVVASSAAIFTWHCWTSGPHWLLARQFGIYDISMHSIKS